MCMPGSGNYVRLMEHIQREVNEFSPSFAADIALYRDHPLSRVDMQDLPAEKIALFLRGVKLVEQKFIKQLRRFHRNNITLILVSELKALLWLDQRIQDETYPRLGTIIVDDSRTWVKPGWVYNIILSEMLQSIAYMENVGYIPNKILKISPTIDLMNRLASACEDYHLDFRSFSHEDLKSIRAALDFVEMSYVEAQALHTLNPLQVHLPPAASELMQLYQDAYPDITSWWEQEPDI